MAKIRSGILGGISGKIGNIVGGRWRGIDYIRTKPANVKNPNTEAQQRHRMRFTLITQFLKKAKAVVKVGFRNQAKNKTARNVALAYNIKTAIKGTFPDLELDLEEIVLSDGGLPGVQEASMDASVPGQVTLSWASDTSASNASESDGAFLLLYNPIKDEAVYNMFGASRGDESHEQSIPTQWEADEIAGYLSFRSESDNEVSRSQYLGIETAATTP